MRRGLPEHLPFALWVLGPLLIPLVVLMVPAVVMTHTSPLTADWQSCLAGAFFTTLGLLLLQAGIWCRALALRFRSILSRYFIVWLYVTAAAFFMAYQVAAAFGGVSVAMASAESGVSRADIHAQAMFISAKVVFLSQFFILPWLRFAFSMLQEQDPDFFHRNWTQ
jgi:hypothetical protein